MWPSPQDKMDLFLNSQLARMRPSPRLLSPNHHLLSFFQLWVKSLTGKLSVQSYHTQHEFWEPPQSSSPSPTLVGALPRRRAAIRLDRRPTPQPAARSAPSPTPTEPQGHPLLSFTRGQTWSVQHDHSAPLDFSRGRLRACSVFKFVCLNSLLCAQESKQWGKAAQEAVGGGGGHQVDLDEEDDLEEFRLPMSHRPTENLDTEGLEQASVHTQLTASNVGFRLLQKMGWKTGKGLGKNEQGIFRLLLYMLPFYCHDCLLVPMEIENPPLGACIIFFFP